MRLFGILKMESKSICFLKKLIYGNSKHFCYCMKFCVDYEAFAAFHSLHCILVNDCGACRLLHAGLFQALCAGYKLQCQQYYFFRILYDFQTFLYSFHYCNSGYVYCDLPNMHLKQYSVAKQSARLLWADIVMLFQSKW